MGEQAGTERSLSAIEETQAVLTITESSPPVQMGYIDVLGEDSALGPHLNQRVFARKFPTKAYERMWRPFAGRVLFGRQDEEPRIAMSMLDLAPGDRVIDVGCGPGNYTRRLAQASGSGLVVGIDASAAMLAIAARKGGGSNLAYVRGDGAALPFADGEFDAACSVGVIHLIEEPMTALDEIVRVLAPGGRLVIGATCRYKSSVPRERGGITFFEPDELAGALADRGMIDIDQRLAGRGQFVAANRPGG